MRVTEGYARRPSNEVVLRIYWVNLAAETSTLQVLQHRAADGSRRWLAPTSATLCG